MPFENCFHHRCALIPEQHFISRISTKLTFQYDHKHKTYSQQKCEFLMRSKLEMKHRTLACAHFDALYTFDECLLCPSMYVCMKKWRYFHISTHIELVLFQFIVYMRFFLFSHR